MDNKDNSTDDILSLLENKMSKDIFNSNLKRELGILRNYGLDLYKNQNDYTFFDILMVFIILEFIDFNFSKNNIGTIFDYLNEPFGWDKIEDFKRYKITFLNLNISQFMVDKNKFFLLIPKELQGGDNILFLSDIYLSEVIAGKSPLNSELYINSSSFFIIDMSDLIEKIVGKKIFDNKNILGEIITDFIDEESKEINIDLASKFIEKTKEYPLEEKIVDIKKEYPFSDINISNHNGEETKINVVEKIKLKKSKRGL